MTHHDHGIDELAASLRAWFDEDEDEARSTAWNPSTKTHNGWEAVPPADWSDNWRIRQQGQGAILLYCESKEITRHIARHDPARALREVEWKRALLAHILSERHLVVDGDCWYTCTAATEERDGGENCDDERRGQPCDCGRDKRVTERLQMLALPYVSRPDHQEAERG